jgi:hypothetical protein
LSGVGTDGQADVVGHQAIGKVAERVATLCFGERVEERKPVLVVEEHVGLVIAAIQGVKRNHPVGIGSRESRHASNLAWIIPVIHRKNELTPDFARANGSDLVSLDAIDPRTY